MPNPSATNAILISNYNKAIRELETKLARQQNSVEATLGQIEGFKALVAQLEGKK